MSSCYYCGYLVGGTYVVIADDRDFVAFPEILIAVAVVIAVVFIVVVEVACFFRPRICCCCFHIVFMLWRLTTFLSYRMGQ